MLANVLQMTRRGSQQSTTTIPTSDSKWRGQLVYPTPPTDGIKAGIAAHNLSTDSNASEAGEDKAVDVAVNGRLGLVAVGTEW